MATTMELGTNRNGRIRSGTQPRCFTQGGRFWQLKERPGAVDESKNEHVDSQQPTKRIR